MTRLRAALRSQRLLSEVLQSDPQLACNMRVDVAACSRHALSSARSAPACREPASRWLLEYSVGLWFEDLEGYAKVLAALVCSAAALSWVAHLLYSTCTSARAVCECVKQRGSLLSRTGATPKSSHMRTAAQSI